MKKNKKQLLALMLALVFTCVLSANFFSTTVKAQIYEVNISEWGVYSDDSPEDLNDDGLLIKRAIDYCLANGVPVLNFDIPNKTYIVNRELVVDGSNLTIKGNNCTLRKTAACTSNNKGAFFTIEGTSTPAQEIHVKNLNLVFTQERTLNEVYTNGFGISNAQTVSLEDCTVYGAPQTSFAVVSSKTQIIDDVKLIRCTGKNSKNHTFRLNAADGSTHFKAGMYSCKAVNTTRPNIGYSMEGKFAHLYCNMTPKAAVSSNGANNFYQIVENCVFDQTGAVYVNNNCRVAFRGCTFQHKDGIQRLSPTAIISIGK